jgi:hypothetical protein
MTGEEVIKLVLDYGNAAKDTTEVSDRLDKLTVAAKAVGGEGFGELVSKSVEVIKTLREQATAAKDAGEETKTGLAALAAGGQTLFGAFQTKDVGAAIEGVTSLVALVPGLSTFGPAITLVGKGAAAAWPVLKEWWGYLNEINTKMVDATKGLNEYAGALQKANLALKDSEALAAARAKDKTDAGTPGSRQKERADTIESMLKGREEQSLKEVVGAVDIMADERNAQIDEIQAKYQARMKEIKERPSIEPVDRAFRAEATAKAKAAMDKVGTGEKEQKKAEELFAKARGGDAGAIEELMKVLPAGSTTREILRMGSPEAQDADRAAKRDVADQERRFKEGQAQDRAKAAANDQVQAQIKAAQAGAAEKILARREAEERGPAAQERAQQEAIQDARRMGNQIGAAGQAQRAAQSANLAQPRMPLVSMNATQEQAMQIMAQNQLLSAQEDRANGQRFRQMLEDAKAANQITRENLRTNQSHGGP